MSILDSPSHKMNEQEQANREHDAWRQLCLHLEQHLPRNVTINDGCDFLIITVKLWGEELAQLRRMQDPAVASRALMDARWRGHRHDG